MYSTLDGVCERVLPVLLVINTFICIPYYSIYSSYTLVYTAMMLSMAVFICVSYFIDKYGIQLLKNAKRLLKAVAIACLLIMIREDIKEIVLSVANFNLSSSKIDSAFVIFLGVLSVISSVALTKIILNILDGKIGSVYMSICNCIYIVGIISIIHILNGSGILNLTLRGFDKPYVINCITILLYLRHFRKIAKQQFIDRLMKISTDQK